MINWELMRHPLNWIIVILMLTIAGAAGHLLLTHFGAEPSGSETPKSPVDREFTRSEYAASVLG
jgi:hypothetical protein